MSFHNDFATTEDGRTFRAGEVVYTFGDGREAFSHGVILGFENGYAKVARPYAYASSVGTTGPSALVGVETYECRVECLKTIPASTRVI